MDTNFFTLAGKLSDSKIVFLEVKFYLFVIEFFIQLIIYDLSSSTGTVILRLFFFYFDPNSTNIYNLFCLYCVKNIDTALKTKI